MPTAESAGEAAPLLLVVDDNDAVRFGKVGLIRRAGYRVAEASTGREGLRLSERLHPDLVLLDVNLPDMSGFEVCRQLKSGENGAPVHVLQISSTAVTDGDRSHGLLSGADAYLTEPVSTDVLLATIAALIRVHRAEQQLAAAVIRERLARDEAETANRFKDEFLATLSHELRTPLSAMVGWIWQLRHGMGDETIQQHALDALERNTNLQVRMINDLLDISRISRGKLELDLAPVELHKVVEAALDSVQQSLRTKQLTMTVSTTPVTILGDAPRLQQIVVNLLTNAIKFNVPRGQIDVSLTSASGAAIISVRDTGTGIDASLLPHVFETFRQGESDFARRYAGLGLGLAIVRKLVTLHGGTVIAESEGRGHGAVFIVRLPVTGVTYDEARVEPEPIGRPLEGLRLLLIDDDADNRAWMKRVVEFGGGTATVVPSAREALNVLDAERFDALVSDIGMPEFDGVMLIQTLRARGYPGPAAAVTAFASAGERRRILDAGYDAHFSKPIEPDVFLTKLKALVQAYQSRTPAHPPSA